jgi:hypothetical protein
MLQLIKEMMQLGDDDDEMNSDALAVARMPLAAGGLGLTSAVSLAHVAFIASLCDAVSQFRDLFKAAFESLAVLSDGSHRLAVQVQHAFERMPTALPGRPPLAGIPRTVEDLKVKQRSMQQRLAAAQATVCLDQVLQDHDDDLAFRMRLTSQACPGARAIWRTIPSEEALRYSDELMTFTLRRWLGVSNVPRAMQGRECPRCRKHVITDDHLLTCHTSHVSFRHHGVVDETVDMLRAVRRHVTHEPYDLPEYEGRRPDLEVLNFWDRGIPDAIFDATVAHVTTSTLLGRIAEVDANTPCYAAEKAAERKRKENEAICRRMRRDFRPFAVETTGALGKDARDIIKRAAAIHDDLDTVRGRYSYGDTWTVATFQDYWTQRIVAAVHKGSFRNAQTVLTGRSLD